MLDWEQLEKQQNEQWYEAEVLPARADQIASLLSEAYVLYSQKKFDESKNLFEGVFSLDPRNPYANAMLGSLYQREGALDLALAHYTVSLRVFPQDIDTLTNRGELYFKLGRFREAAADFRRAIQLDLLKNKPAGERARLLLSFVSSTEC